MEHPSIMSLSKNRVKISLRLTTIALAASIAGCGSSPPPYEGSPAPQRSSSASRAASSMDAGASSQSSQQQTLVLIEEGPTRVPLAEGHPDEYVVQDGDTLWDIAATFLKDPWYWPEVWYVNPQIDNPHLIFPGDTLALVSVGGQQRITTTSRGPSYRMSPTVSTGSTTSRGATRARTGTHRLRRDGSGSDSIRQRPAR